MSNRKLPAIPEPGLAPESQRDAILALKLGLEILGRLRRNDDKMDSAVTFNDLVRLGLITEAQAKKIL